MSKLSTASNAVSRFTATIDQRHHLSVGALLRVPGDRYVVLESGDPEAPVLGMMTETLENWESLESGVVRGILEELGVAAKTERYVGTTQDLVVDHRGAWTKTTVWFLCTTQQKPVQKGIRLLQYPQQIRNTEPGRWPRDLLSFL